MLTIYCKNDVTALHYFFFIIRVKQKASKRITQHNDVHCIEGPEIVEKQPLPTDNEMLAIEYKKDDDSNQQEGVQYNHQNVVNAASHYNTRNDDITLKRKCQDGERGSPGTSKYPPFSFFLQ